MKLMYEVGGHAAACPLRPVEYLCITKTGFRPAPERQCADCGVFLDRGEKLPFNEKPQRIHFIGEALASSPRRRPGSSFYNFQWGSATSTSWRANAMARCTLE